MSDTLSMIPESRRSSDQNRPDDYGVVLEQFEVPYRLDGIYLQVGEIPWVQGWVLHISVIMSQMNELLEKVLPTLIGNRVSFKVIKDKDTARELLDGHLGYTQLAKIVSIYPESEAIAEGLANALISLTRSLKGPDIPTDVHLGGCVYTRFGCGNPVILLDPAGNPQKCISDSKGQLIADPYCIPFVVPQGVRWPFGGIVGPKPSVPKKTLKGIYKPIAVFKADPRGNVWKAVYLKGLFKTGSCVIKEGRKNMCSDEDGRDVIDRLRWQQDLHKNLEGVVPLPKILDFFEDDGNAYLAIEFIEGISLEECIRLIGRNGKSWLDLTQLQQLALVDYLLSIVQMLEALHAKGYVHRDIQAANFLVDPKGKMYMIDVELAYSVRDGRPSPPYGLGTPGCMSPEQLARKIPTVKEDIYGLSAMMLNTLVGIVPVRFNQIVEPPILEDDIDFFIRNRKMAELIAAGLSPDVGDRPDLGVIRHALDEFRTGVAGGISPEGAQSFDAPSRSDMKRVIDGALYALVNPPMLLEDGLWLSKTTDKDPNIATLQKGYSINPGLESGVGGVLYLLARAKMGGWDIGGCMDNFRKGWDYLLGNVLGRVAEMPPGLYGGTAGVALALATGIKAELLKDDPLSRQMLSGCFEVGAHDPTLASGIAGQGVALLQCISILSTESARKRLEQCVQVLLGQQQKDGSWVVPTKDGGSSGAKSLSFGYGGAGIAWFLLQYQAGYPNDVLRRAIEKAMGWLDWATDQLRKSIDPGTNEGGSGILLTFIKAFEVLRDVRYKKAVEESLLANPEHIVDNDFSQAGGLAEIGELYLEAAKVFQNNVWRRRAEWVAQLFMHSCIPVPEGGCYWAMSQNTYPTADFMRGNSGVVHFLLRMHAEDQIGYRLLM